MLTPKENYEEQERNFKSYSWAALTFLCALIMTFSGIGKAEAAPALTIEQAIAGGQNYLFTSFISLDDNSGYWGDESGSPLAATASAVSALIETGKASDPAYKAVIDKGINYIKSYVQADGGIYSNQYHMSYENGLAIVALCLYGKTFPQDDAYKAIVRNAAQLFLDYQNIEGSPKGGNYGPDSDYGNYYGGWSYYPSGQYASADLSNTQFAVMGLWYANQYIGYPSMTGAAWSEALFKFLKKNQDYNNNGAFSYFAGTTSFQSGTMTGAGIWSLAMIGESKTLRGAPMITAAVDWLNTVYTWSTVPGSSDSSGSYYYFTYAMAKGLTAAVGPTGTVGTHNWVEDLKTTMLAKVTIVDASTNYWYSGGGLDPGRNMTTAWVLMSLAFSDQNTPSPEKILVSPDDADFPMPNQGMLVLSTPAIYTISAAAWGNAGRATLPGGVKLPMGSLDFTITLPPGQTSVIVRIGNLPSGILDPNNPNSFINADGSVKAGLNWFKIVNGTWKGTGVPVAINRAGNYIEVTLTDNGPADENPASGIITDPGAAGYGDSTESSGGGDNGWCFIATAAYGSYMEPNVLVLRHFRDKYLMTNSTGRAIVAWYYRNSPPVAQFISRHESLKTAARVAMAPIVYGVKYPFAIIIGLVIGISEWRRRRI